MSFRHGASFGQALNFRQASEIDSEKILSFLSGELLYNVEIITIIENIGIRGKSFSIYLLEDEKEANKSILATLFVGRDYANLYLAKEVRITKGRAVLQEAWDLICGLSLRENLQYLYLNDEMDFHLKLLPADHVITQTICSYSKFLKDTEPLKSAKLLKNIEFLKNAKSLKDIEPLNNIKSLESVQDLRNSRFDELQKAYDLSKCRIEVLKSDQAVIHSVLTLHRECFDSVLSAENYGKLIDLKMMRSYYLLLEDQVICKGEWIINNRNTAYISGLCTKKGFRNMGFCSILLERMLMEIRTCNRVAILNYESEDLSHFYSKLGFQCEYIRRRVWLRI